LPARDHDRAVGGVRIGWIKLKAYTGARYAMTFDVEFSQPKANPRDSTDVSVDFEQRITQEDRLPVFYLPFLSSTTTELRELELRGTEESTSLPLSVRPFYPEGAGQAELWDTFRKSDI